MFNADGVDVSWTQMSPETIKDFNAVTDFINELRKKMPTPKKIFVSVANIKDQPERFNFSSFSE